MFVVPSEAGEAGSVKVQSNLRDAQVERQVYIDSGCLS